MLTMSETQAVEAEQTPRKRGRPAGSRKSATVMLHREIVDCTKKGTGMSNREIADKVGCDRRTVGAVLAKYGINKDELEEYRDNQADILLGIQKNISVSITEADIKSASFRDRMVGMGIAIDKYRLITGQSTANISAWLGIVKDAQIKGANPPIDVTPIP